MQAKGLPLSADSGAYAASAPKGIFKAFGRKLRAKALSRANHLCSKEANKAPHRASLPSSSSTKLALRSGAKGSSLGVDSGAYAASAPKDAPKVLSREARAKAHCANNEATAVPLTSSALLGSARLAANDKTKALSAKDLSREVKNEILLEC